MTGSGDSTELAGYLRYDAINKMLVKHMEDVNANKGKHHDLDLFIDAQISLFC